MREEVCDPPVAAFGVPPIELKNARVIPDEQVGQGQPSSMGRRSEAMERAPGRSVVRKRGSEVERRGNEEGGSGLSERDGERKRVEHEREDALVFRNPSKVIA